MPREVVSLHVGQCGLQLGMSFWQQAAHEHRLDDGAVGACDDAASSFFYASSSSPSAVQSRCVLVDTEPRVLSTIARSPLFSSLLDSSCVVSDVSGAGNNFAVGWLRYGPQYASQLQQAVRRQAERCDSLQAFLLSHSTGGGTGSGLGSFLLSQLRDDYPDCCSIDLCVLPSEQEEHVVTAPYNAALSLQQLAAAADLVLPVDNAALSAIVRSQQPPAPPSAPQSARASPVPLSSSIRAMGGGFAPLNGVCAAVLCSLTAGLRFGGELNLDLTDLTQTLCPFPSTKLLIPSMTHLQPIVRHYTAGGSRPAAASRSPSRPRPSAAPLSLSECYFHTLSRAAALLAKSTAALSDSALQLDSGGPQRGRSEWQQEDALFQSLLQPQQRLLQADTSSASYLSCALLARGELSFGSLQRQVTLLSRQMRFVPLCSAAASSSTGSSGSWKLSLCAVPSAWSACSVLALSNSSAMAARLDCLIRSCESLYRRRAHWHHYTECGLEDEDMTDALHSLRDLCTQYTAYT